MQTVKPGIYKHYKGNVYKVLGIAKHSETLETLVVYEALYENHEGTLWIRPVNMFVETVIVAGKKVPRFLYIKEI